ncbi:general transcription factor 3C polypeptide 6 [Periplaneta americana]|uniref:general transcription factor 3C polypeptide 6 n=1 Tax=Periplaneta americana TaxID=6978 RepID=UPI0037E8BB69
MSSSEEEEFLVHVEFNGMLEKDVLERNRVFFRMIGAEGRKPVMQIGNQTFSGEYRDTVGTALFFEEDAAPPGGDPVFSKTPDHQLRYVCKTRKSLQMSRVFLRRKDSSEGIDISDSDSEVNASENAKNKDKESKDSNLQRETSSDELTMEVEEFPELVHRKKKQMPKHKPEPTAGPSGASDIASSDLADLGALIAATTSKTVTAETSNIVEEQIRSVSDTIKSMETESSDVPED